jgi:hypothetical protein
VNFCIDLLDHQPSNLHRVIVLLSQGKDEGSNTSPEEFVKHLGRSNVAIYSITFSSQKTHTRVEAGVPAKGEAILEIASEALCDNTATEVAALSGGEEMTFANSGDLDGTLSALASDLTTSYTLSFHPKSDQPGLHVIQVEMKKKKDMVTVAARPNYWVSGTGK